MQDGFTQKVLEVLSDPMNLPSEFLDYMVQHQAVNGLPSAPAKGDLLAWDKRTSPVTNSGSSFATGADILASPLTLTAQGNSSYLLYVAADGWSNNTAPPAFNVLHINLNGADNGILATAGWSAGASTPLSASGVMFSLPNGSYTVNVRLRIGGAVSTATISGGSGGAGADCPILVALYHL